MEQRSGGALMDDAPMHERVAVNVSFDRERGYVTAIPSWAASPRCRCPACDAR
jgi:hypothetical protein